MRRIFQKVDVFKRHLKVVHLVKKTPPKSNKNAASGMSPRKKVTSWAPDFCQVQHLNVKEGLERNRHVSSSEVDEAESTTAAQA